MQKQYKLLTPGPLTTTDTVKQVMLFDHCTWDDDYKQITQSIRAQLLELAHVSAPDYTAVLMQGSGSFGVESVLTSVIGPDEKLLIALKELRRSLAMRQSVPAYVVFSDATLMDMCRIKPKTRDEFMEVSGVGQRKAIRYGEVFLATIAEFL